LIKNIISRGLLAVVVCAGVAVAAVMDPNTRMEKVRDLFTEYGPDAFKLLQGLDLGGTGTSDSGKGAQVTNRGDIAEVAKSEDGNSFVFCVVDGKWAVYPPEPMKVGSDAMTATDANGRPFVATMITALRNSPTPGRAHHVRYDVLTPDGRVQAREATLWKSSELLMRKNNTGKKFFCGTSVKANP